MAAHDFPINLPAIAQWRDNDHGKSHTLGALGNANTSCPLTTKLGFMNVRRESATMKLSFTPWTKNLDGSFTRDIDTSISLIYTTEQVLKCSDIIYPSRLDNLPWNIRPEVLQMGRYRLISLEFDVKQQPFILMPRAPKPLVDERELEQVLLLKSLSRANQFSLFMSINGSEEEIRCFKDTLQFERGSGSTLTFDSVSHVTMRSPNDEYWNRIYIKATGDSAITVSDLERLQTKQLPGASTSGLRVDSQLKIRNQDAALNYDDPIEQNRGIEGPPEGEKTSEQRMAYLRKTVQEQTSALKQDNDKAFVKQDQEYMPQAKEKTETMQQGATERPKKRVRFADELDDPRTLADDFLNRLAEEMSMSARAIIQRNMTDNVMEQQPESGAEVEDNTAPQTTVHGATITATRFTAILNGPVPELSQVPTPDSSLGLQAHWRRWAVWVIMQPQTEPGVIGSLMQEAYQAAARNDAEGFVGKIESILESLGITGGGGDGPV